MSEAPRGKPRGIFAEPCEAKDAILSFIATLATEDPPCGKPHGFPWPTRVVSGRLAKKGECYIIIVQYSGNKKPIMALIVFFNGKICYLLT